jgi:hypothetical protein
LLRSDWRNILGGLALLAIGGFFMSGALEMPIGTARRMGPGYFPMLLAAIIMALGLVILVPAFLRRGQLQRPAWRPFAAVLASIAAFAVTMRPFGLIPAVIVTVLVSAVADRSSRPFAAVILATGLALASWLLFVVALGLPMTVIRTPF